MAERMTFTAHAALKCWWQSRLTGKKITAHPALTFRWQSRMTGKKMCVMAGVTGADLGCDLLISVYDIRQFESDGYRLSTR